jgi:predicted transposase YbfD/YdcC
MHPFARVFQTLPDPRANNARHDLTEMLLIALAAVLCGAQSCADMADFGRAKEPVLRQFLRLEHGIPSHDTFSRVFRILDAQAFETAFHTFMASFARQITGVVAIDGKALRGAFERGRKSTPLHLVNVWAADARLAIGQHLAPRRNEVAGALEVLKLLSLRGCVVTADALHCHRAMAQGVLEQAAHYVLALKENQSTLYADAKALLEPLAHQVEDVAAPAHDRLEERRASVVPATALGRKHGFVGLKALGRVELRRRVGGLEHEPMVRYFVLSKCFSPARLLSITRSHWGIENQLHWVLDVVFDEDRARNRKEHGPQNMAVLRKLALNVLRSDPDKASIRRKIKRAGWDDSFLIQLLGQMR